MGNQPVLLRIAVCSTLLMGLLASSPSAAGEGNCQAKLVGKSFACNISFPEWTSRDRLLRILQWRNLRILIFSMI